MQSILPGQPQAHLHGLDYSYHGDLLVVVYLSGSTCIVLHGHDIVAQILSPPAVNGGLRAVRVQQGSSRIALVSARQCFVYGPIEDVKDKPRWLQEMSFEVEESYGDIQTLCWGSDGELLVGTDHILALFNARMPSPQASPVPRAIHDALVKPVWTRSVPSKLLFAELSPSSFAIATSSRYDRAVKIWRRLSFESPEFDYTYLRHPEVVTHVVWRGSRRWGYGNDRDEDVLFTSCADGIFRIWRTMGVQGTDVLSLFAKIDTVSVIQPEIKSASNSARFVHVLEADVVERLTDDGPNQAQASKARRSDHAYEYLKEVASRKPDIFIITDASGHMSAWGLESVGCKRRMNDASTPTQLFHICQHEGVHLHYSKWVEQRYNNVRTFALQRFSNPGQLIVLNHHFDGRITWQQALLQNLLDPGQCEGRLPLLSTWTGHESPIKKVIRTASGKALVSRTADNDAIVWRAQNQTLHRRSSLSVREHIHRVLLLRNGEFLVCLHHNKITVWDCRSPDACEVASYNCDRGDMKPLCLLLLPNKTEYARHLYLAVIDEDRTGQVWRLSFDDEGSKQETMKVRLESFSDITIDAGNDVQYILPVDPAGNPTLASEFLDAFSQDVAMSYSATGRLCTFTARVNEADSSVQFLTTSVVETGLHSPSMGSATSIRRAALVDATKKRLTIWDTRSGRLDHDENFEENINDLDWASAPDSQSILAVGVIRSVHVYTQLRYDYLNERPAWGRVKTVDLPEWSLTPIADSVWLGQGGFVIGSGNQLLVMTDKIDVQRDPDVSLRSSIPHDRISSLFDLVQLMNGPLPVFHPQFISQCVLAGKLRFVSTVLNNLVAVLRFFTEGDRLDPMLGIDVEHVLGIGMKVGSSDGSVNADALSNHTTFSPEAGQTLADLLSQKSLPHLTSPEQLTLVSIIECVATVLENSRSIDDNASRYLMFWQLRSLSTHRPSSGPMTWRETAFATHSASQDILASLILSTDRAPLTWSVARESKLFAWLSSREALLKHFEDMARNIYTSTDPKDPVSCSLHYVALRKKQVLVGLWRMATWSREQAATMRLLRNDFTEQRWKTAAQKNAFALMGRRRFDYAAAFFLLSDDLKSALSVIANQMGDVDLAIAVGRVYGGDDNEDLRNLIRTWVLAPAIKSGDRWAATWALWFAAEKSNAVRALVTPLGKLDLMAADEKDPSADPTQSISAKSFLNDDPALVVLYEQLRSRSLQTLRGALMIDGGDESRFVMRTAGLWRRMGCDILALDLVANWEFLQTDRQSRADLAGSMREARENVSELPLSPSLNREWDPRKLLRRRSSLVVDDMSESLRSSNTQRTPNILEGFGFNDPPPSREAHMPASILDAYGDFEPTTQETKARSLLDDFGSNASTNQMSVKSMLDDFTNPSDAVQAAPRSMLDDFESVKQKPSAPKSMLEDWGERSPTSSADREARAEKERTAPKPPPKEDVGSILDNFGF